jgi:hypothetical protein
MLSLCRMTAQVFSCTIVDRGMGSWGETAMHQAAGWSDVWHAALSLIAQEPPFAQIAIVLGLAFVAVMALEGIRGSLTAMMHAHRVQPAPLEAPKPEPVEMAMPAGAPTRSFSIPREFQTVRPKRLSVPARKFREMRPTIRRNSSLSAAE